MKTGLRCAALAIGAIAVAAVFYACEGDGASDNNLPTRRAMMREIKISTDRTMAVLKNRSIEGVEADARRIQANFSEVIDLYPPDHKAKYINYNKEAQQAALRMAQFASAGDVKGANKAFRELVPNCNSCHEDCAYMLAPAFPEFAD